MPEHNRIKRGNIGLYPCCGGGPHCCGGGGGGPHCGGGTFHCGGFAARRRRCFSSCRLSIPQITAIANPAAMILTVSLVILSQVRERKSSALFAPTESLVTNRPRIFETIQSPHQNPSRGDEA